METIKNELKNIKQLEIDQNAINNLLKNLYNEAKTESQKWHYKNKLNGGRCFYCGKEYKKRNKKTTFSNYVIFENQCNCYEKKEEEIKKRQMQKLILSFANIPTKYLNKTFENIDMKNIDNQLKIQIENVKSYLKEKLYKEGIGCLFYGDIGTGKTLLAILIFRHLLIEENMSGIYIRMSDILKDIIRNNFNFTEKLTEYKVVLLDDLDKLKAAKGTAKSGWVAERMFSMFDTLYNNGTVVLATTNIQNLNELKTFFDTAIVSRIIGSSDIFKMSGGDYRVFERKEKIKR